MAWGRVICVTSPPTPGQVVLTRWGRGVPRNAARVCDKVEATQGPAWGVDFPLGRDGARLGLEWGPRAVLRPWGVPHSEAAVGGWRAQA